MNKIMAMREDTKYSLMSVIPISLALLLHTIHLVLAPALLGIGSMAMSVHQHHDMSTGAGTGTSIAPASGGLSWFALAFFILNGVGIYYACRVLWKSRSMKSEGRHTIVCKVISIASIVVGVVSGITLFK
jgi:uncharacterized membrane protein